MPAAVRVGQARGIAGSLVEDRDCGEAVWGQDSCGRREVWRRVKDQEMKRSLLENILGSGHGAEHALVQVC